jgi:hypothetical protein
VNDVPEFKSRQSRLYGFVTWNGDYGRSGTGRTGGDAAAN